MRALSVEAYTALIASYQSIIHKSFSCQMLATQGWWSDREKALVWEWNGGTEKGRGGERDRDRERGGERGGKGG